MSSRVMLGILRSDDDPLAGSDPALALPRGVRFELLRGVHSPNRFAVLLWLDDEVDAGGIRASLEQSLGLRFGDTALASLEWRTFYVRLEVGDNRISARNNVIIREIEPEALGSFLPALNEQMARIENLDGCRASFLGESDEHPGMLLGITRWSDMASLEAYLAWPGAHEFKSTVDPVTLKVPLRLLTEPLS